MSGTRTGSAVVRSWRPGYGTVMALLVVTLFVGPFASVKPIGGLASLVVAALTLLTMLVVARARRRTLIIVGSLVAVALSAAVLALVFAGDARTAIGVQGLVILAIAASGPFVIGRDLIRHHLISAQTVLGAIDIYLLVGLFYAVLYSLVAVLTPAFSAQSAFAGGEMVRGLDLYYYSFIILTTVGLGDITPQTDLVRVLTISEALLGQIYLVTVLALLVGKMGSQRRSGGDDDAASR